MKEIINEYIEAKRKYDETCEKQKRMAEPYHKLMDEGKISEDEWIEKLEKVDDEVGLDEAMMQCIDAEKKLIKRGIEEFKKMARDEKEKEMFNEIEEGIYLPSVREKVIDLIIKFL